MVFKRAFTIVELLVVIIVIAVLVSLSIVGYSGISFKATASTLQSDLTNAKKQLLAYQMQSTTSSFPTAINCTNPSVTEICIRPSISSTTFNYNPNNSVNPKTFILIAASGAMNYWITNALPAMTTPDVVTDGLVLYIDAANPSSYSGSGSVLINLVNNPSFPNMYLAGQTSTSSIADGVVNISGGIGNFNQGGYLQGNGNMATIVNGDFTSMGWLYRVSNDSGEVMSYRDSSLRLAFDTENTQMIFNQRETFSPYIVRSTAVAVNNNLNTWYHFALSKSGNNYSFYRNGVLLATNNFTMTETITAGSYYNVGVAWSDDDFTNSAMDGKIGPIMQYNKALSASEVLQNFNAFRGRYGL